MNPIKKRKISSLASCYLFQLKIFPIFSRIVLFLASCFLFPIMRSLISYRSVKPLASCLVKKRSVICFMCFLLLFLCGCKDLKQAQCTGVKGFKVNKLDPSGINAYVLLGIKNPNNFSFSVYRSTFDVYYNGTFLGKARSKKVRIDANAEKTYSFNLKSDFKNVSLMDVLNLAKGGGKGTLQVKGNLKAGKFYIKKKIPIDVKERVSMDK